MDTSGEDISPTGSSLPSAEEALTQIQIEQLRTPEPAAHHAKTAPTPILVPKKKAVRGGRRVCHMPKRPKALTGIPQGIWYQILCRACCAFEFCFNTARLFFDKHSVLKRLEENGEDGKVYIVRSLPRENNRRQIVRVEEDGKGYTGMLFADENGLPVLVLEDTFVAGLVEDQDCLFPPTCPTTPDMQSAFNTLVTDALKTCMYRKCCVNEAVRGMEPETDVRSYHESCFVWDLVITASKYKEQFKDFTEGASSDSMVLAQLTRYPQERLCEVTVGRRLHFD